MRIMLISGSTRPGSKNTDVFSTPEYAGGPPGTLKNLLGWTVGGRQLYAKAVAWLDVANPGRGDESRVQLRTALGHVGAHIVDNACIHIALDGADDLPVPAREHRQLSVALTDAVTARQS